MEKQYIYIFTNPEKPELIKVGRTNKHPEIRANELSRQTAAIGKFIVEWHLEVSDSEIAEKVAHFKLKEFHHSKEYFSISAYDAHLILEQFIIPLFEIENPIIFYSQTLSRKNRLIKLSKALSLFNSNETQEESLVDTEKENRKKETENREDQFQKRKNEQLKLAKLASNN